MFVVFLLFSFLGLVGWIISFRHEISLKMKALSKWSRFRHQWENRAPRAPVWNRQLGKTAWRWLNPIYIQSLCALDAFQLMPSFIFVYTGCVICIFLNITLPSFLSLPNGLNNFSNRISSSWLNKRRGLYQACLIQYHIQVLVVRTSLSTVDSLQCYGRLWSWRYLRRSANRAT